MFIFLDKKREKFNQWLKIKTTIDFSDWGVIILFILGLFAIFYFGKGTNLSNLISVVVLWFTAIVILQYTKETYWLKQIQSKQLKETRKSRYLEKMPMLRVVSMDIEKKASEFMGVAASFPSIKDANFYKLVYKNIGDDWAFINKITMWVGNLTPEKEIIFEENTFRKTLFKNEEDIVVTYEIETEKREDEYRFLYPRKIEILFSDRYGNNFVYTTVKVLKLAEPTPYLGLIDYFKEEIKYPPNLK